MSKDKIIECAIYIAFCAVLASVTTGWQFYVLLALFIAGCVADYNQGMDKGAEIATRVWGIPRSSDER